MHTEQQAFDTLVDEFFQGWCRYHPEAVYHQAGDADLAALQLVDDDDTRVLCSWLESLLIGLDEINLADLDKQHRTEFLWLSRYVLIERRSLCGQDWRLHDPLAWVERIQLGLGISQAGSQEQIDPKALALLPDFIRHACGLLEQGRPIASYFQQAAQNQLAHLLCELKQAHVTRSARTQASDREDLLQQAIRSLQSFDDHLRTLDLLQDESSLPLTVGYEQNLQLHYGINRSIPWLQSWLQYSIENAQQAWQRATEKSSELEHYRTDAGQRLNEACQQARQFVADHEWFDLNPVADLSIHPAKPCQASAAVLEYWPQPACAPELYLSVPEAGLSQAQINSLAWRFAWPGQHLISQMHIHSKVAQRPIRRYLNSKAWPVCWQLYAEDLMWHSGASEGADGEQPLLFNQLQQLALAQADFDLNRGLSVAEVRDRLQAVPGMTAASVAHSLVAITRYPGKQLAAVYWWLLLRAARQQLAASEKSLQDFHNRLLTAGPVPLPWLLSDLLGEKNLQMIESQIAHE